MYNPDGTLKDKDILDARIKRQDLMHIINLQ
jgi:hypothetical protein